MDKQPVTTFDGSDQSIGAVSTSLMTVTFLAQVIIHSVAAMYTHALDCLGFRVCVKYINAQSRPDLQHDSKDTDDMMTSCEPRLPSILMWSGCSAIACKRGEFHSEGAKRGGPSWLDRDQHPTPAALCSEDLFARRRATFSVGQGSCRRRSPRRSCGAGPRPAQSTGPELENLEAKHLVGVLRSEAVLPVFQAFIHFDLVEVPAQRRDVEAPRAR